MTGSIINLEYVMNKADDIDVASGILSYGKYNKLMSDLAFKYGCTVEQATAVFVSTSPNNDYIGNLRSTVSILDGWKRGRTCDEIIISTYGHCKKRAWHFLNGGDFLKTSKGLKIRAFYSNTVDPSDHIPVTVDVHMVSAWRAKRILAKGAAISKSEYQTIAGYTRELAASNGYIPNQLQGIIWFTWKRINKVLYDNNLNLFGDHWGLDIDICGIKPYSWRDRP